MARLVVRLGDRFGAALGEIDAANADDPAVLVAPGGGVRPKEQLHAELMTAWVDRLDPVADEVAHLAARAHHLRRWELARTEFPEGRSGYLRWRAEQRRRHAVCVRELLLPLGYPEETVAEIGSIIRKEGLGRSSGGTSDTRVQTHEDALCLVFLQTQLAELVERLGPDKMGGVIDRTLPKMSGRAREVARTLPLGPAGRAVIDSALGAGGMATLCAATGTPPASTSEEARRG